MDINALDLPRRAASSVRPGVIARCDR